MNIGQEKPQSTKNNACMERQQIIDSRIAYPLSFVSARGLIKQKLGEKRRGDGKRQQ